MVTPARGGDGGDVRVRGRGALAVLTALMVASLLMLVSPAARAHDYGAVGLGGAQITLSNDGYPGSVGVNFGFGTSDVTGRSFAAISTAQIFECPDYAVDVFSECIPLGSAPTDASGNFGPAPVGLVAFFSTVDKPSTNGGAGVTCRGIKTADQCMVVAVSLDPATQQPTHRAEHFICTGGNNQCKPRPDGSGPTTTTSTSTTTTTTLSTIPPTTLPPVTIPPNPTTTIPPLPPVDPCTLREKVIRHDQPNANDPAVPGASNSTSDVLWQEQDPSASPSARQGHTMAYDPLTRQTVLFGGFRAGTSACVLGDTWIWNGSTWAQALGPDGQPVAGPPARYGHAMAFDGGHIMVFGGYDGRADLDDTWTWNGTSWTPWTPPTPSTPRPSARARTAMAHDPGDPADPADDRVVLFGGDRIVERRGELLGDTWTWNGRVGKWTQHAPVMSPRPRGYAHMAYHPVSGVVLAGGWHGVPLTGTFTWDGATWTQRSDGPYTHSGAMAYRAGTTLAVLQIAKTADPEDSTSEESNSSVFWDGAGWAEPALYLGPPQRAHPAMAEDALGNLVFFGGYGAEKLGEAVPQIRTRAERGDTWILTTPAAVPLPGGDIDRDEKATIEVNPTEIPSDGTTTAQVNVRVTRAGVGWPGYRITLKTDGDVTFAQPTGTTNTEGWFRTTLKASTTPGFERITAEYDRPIPFNQVGLSISRYPSTTLSEKGLTLTLDPASIPADGAATSVATAKVYKAGLVDETVCFNTDGHVTFSTPDGCGVKIDANTWEITMTASTIAGIETITATGRVSGLSATAVLDVGGTAWMDRSASAGGPTPGRYNAAVAYDEDDGVTVLFGGYEEDRRRPDDPDYPAKVLGDTWTWDGSEWASLELPAGAPRPSAREGAAMAYDASSGDLVLFGGHDGDDYLADTWTFDAAARTWSPHLVGGPSKRYMANMSADGVGVVLFAGTAGLAYEFPQGATDPEGPGRLHDTWTWRHGAWTEEKPLSPPPAATASATTRFANTTPVVVPLPPPPPGCPGRACPPDQAQPYPSAITASGLAGKVADVRVTLKGLTHTETGPADLDVMVVAPDGRGVMVMSDACGDADLSPVDFTFDDAAPAGLPPAACSSGRFRPTNVGTAEATPFHTVDVFPAPAPSRASSASLATLRGADPNGTWSLYVVDDTPADPNPIAEAGRIGGGWEIEIVTSAEGGTPPRPATSPPGRGRGAMAFHKPSGKVVLYGGTQEPFRPLGDTWTWDPATKVWAQEGAGTHPGARHSAAMAYHGGTGQLVLFGGSRRLDLGRTAGSTCAPRSPCDANTPWVDDTWTWDGVAWARQSPPVSPPGAFIAGMAPDAAGRLVLVSGLGATATTWTFDSRVSLRIAPYALAADGTSTAVATVRIVDADGHGLAGVATALRSDGDVGLSPVADHGDGTYIATVTASSTGGIETLSVQTPLGSAAATLNEVARPCRPDPPTTAPGTWSSSEVPGMPTPRVRLAAALGGDGRIYTFGGGGLGVGAEGGDVVEAYDVCSHSWHSLPPLPGGARNTAAATAAPDGRIYVVGGHRGSWTATDLVEVYTPGRGAVPGHWNTLPSMLLSRGRPGAAVDAEGNLYVSGGMSAPPAGDQIYQKTYDSVDVYSLGEGRWRPVAPMTRPRYSHRSVVAPDGRIFAVGGGSTTAPFEPGNDVEAFAYDAASGIWERVAPMSQPRKDFGLDVGPDGLLYAVSGVESGGSTFGNGAGTAEAYVSCVDAWVPIEPMASERSAHVAVTGPDGRLYVLGGAARTSVANDPSTILGPVDGGRSTITPVVEVYTVDPATAGLCPRASVDDVRVEEDTVSPATARFTISLDRPPLVETPVSWRTTDGGARAGEDYVEASGTVTFAPGETSKTVEVVVNPDIVVEGDETFIVELSAVPALAGMAKPVGTATIIDAPLPQLSVGSATVAETFSNSVPATFTVSLNEPAPVPVAVDYATIDGSALAGADYTAVNGRVEIPVGASSATVTVPVLGDTLAESTETFSVALSNPSGAGLASARGDGTILDAVGGLSVGDASVAEGGTVSFTVSLAGPVSGPATVKYATADGSAAAGADYTAASGTLHFEAGETSKTVTVDSLDDNAVETTEKFTLALSNPSGAPLARASGEGTIVDDDVAGGDDGGNDGGGAGGDVSPPGPGGTPASSTSPPSPVASALIPALPAASAPLLPSSTQDGRGAVVAPLAPPQPVPNPLTQAQAQQQAQPQSQTQAQQQSQQQAQQQAQAQAQQQVQAQASAQAGMMSERQGERQAEQAHAASRDSSAQVNLASDRRRSRPSPAPILAFIAALMATGLSLLTRQERSPSPQRQQAIRHQRRQPQRHRPLH